MKKMFKLIFGSEGFTMLELLMVIIIIGILASLALPQYTSFVEKARASEGINTIGAIRSAESLYKLENAAYATDISLLTLQNIPTTDNTNTYWYYAVTAPTGQLQVTATRTTKKAATPPAGQTIICTYTDSTGGATWGGTHAGAPKN